jgi:hypothetical protein
MPAGLSRRGAGVRSLVVVPVQPRRRATPRRNTLKAREARGDAQSRRAASATRMLSDGDYQRDGTIGSIPALPAEYCSDARRLSESVACGSFDRGHARAGFKCPLDDPLGEPLVGDRTDGRRGFAVGVKASVLTD